MVFHELSRWDRHEFLWRLGLVAFRVYDNYHGSDDAQFPDINHKQDIRLGYFKQKLVHVQWASKTDLRCAVHGYGTPTSWKDMDY